MDPITVVAVIVGVLAGLGGGFALGIAHRKRVAEAEIGSAELQAKKISEPLLIVALVGRCPANKLIRRIPIPRQ